MSNKPPLTKDDIFGIILNEKSKMRSDNVWGAYSRQSRYDPHNPGYSMETQPDSSEEFARANGAKEIKFYEDPGRSGKNSMREGLQQMTDDIKAQRIDVVVVHRLDRLYRNLASLLVFIQLLQKHNVRFVSVTEHLDTDTWWGRLVMAVLGSLAEAYLYQGSETTIGGIKKRRKNGRHIGRIPLGYCNGLCSTCKDPNGQGYCPLYGKADRPESLRGTLAVPHPVDRHVIPLIHKLYQDGMSFLEVANFLNNHIKTMPDGSEVQFRPRGKR